MRAGAFADGIYKIVRLQHARRLRNIIVYYLGGCRRRLILFRCLSGRDHNICVCVRTYVYKLRGHFVIRDGFFFHNGINTRHRYTSGTVMFEFLKILLLQVKIVTNRNTLLKKTSIFIIFYRNHFFFFFLSISYFFDWQYIIISNSEYFSENINW